MARSTAHRLSRAGHRSKERILTHSDPAKVRETTEGVVLKAGSLFLVTTDSGDVPFLGPHGYGLYFHDCRYLDGYTLRVAVPSNTLGLLRERVVQGDTIHERITVRNYGREPARCGSSSASAPGSRTCSW